MKGIFLAVIAVSLLTTGLASAQTQHLAAAIVTPSAHTDALGTQVANSADEAAFVPIDIINNFPVVSISIGDQQIPVAFDLGGDEPIELTTQALQKIIVRPLPDKYVWLDAKGHRLEARKFLIPELRIGSVIFRDVEGHEDAEAADWPKVHAGLGRLGRKLFQSYILVLDYPGKRFGVLKAKAKLAEIKGCSKDRVAFDPLWNGEPVSKAITDLGELTLVWDTGAPGSFIQSSLLSRQGRSADRTLSQKFMIGGEDFGPLELSGINFVQPEGVDGFLGYNFFSRCRMLLCAIARRTRRKYSSRLQSHLLREGDTARSVGGLGEPTRQPRHCSKSLRRTVNSWNKSTARGKHPSCNVRSKA